jgi:hypothetical protein
VGLLLKLTGCAGWSWGDCAVTGGGAVGVCRGMNHSAPIAVAALAAAALVTSACTHPGAPPPTTSTTTTVPAPLAVAVDSVTYAGVLGRWDVHWSAASGAGLRLIEMPWALPPDPKTAELSGTSASGVFPIQTGGCTVIDPAFIVTDNAGRKASPPAFRVGCVVG